MQNMSTENDRRVLCKELCQEKKKSLWNERKKTWLLVTEARFTIKSSQPAALFAAFTEAFLSLCMCECVWGCTRGTALRAEMCETELDQTLSCCPFHPTAEPAVAQLVLTPFYWFLHSFGMRAGQLFGYLLLLLCISSSAGFHLAVNLQWT